MSSDKPQNDRDQIWITFQIPVSISEKLIAQTKRSGRTKREEAKMRLIDHILRFDSLTEIGKVN